MERKNLIFSFLKLLFLKPSVILEALYHAVTDEVDYDRRAYVEKKYNLKNGLKQIDLLDIFPDMQESISHFTHLHGTSRPIDICVLKLLAKRFSDCQYFEIGTWRGESIVNVAQIATKCVSLSLSDEEMNAAGYGEEFVKMSRLFSKNLPNVKHILHDSKTFDFTPYYKKFDLVFVDGDHSYDGVKSDTASAFKLLRDENSIIVWHDYVAQYEFINWQVFSGILDGAPSECHSDIFQLSNTLCAIYIKGNFLTRPATPPCSRIKNLE